MGNFFKRLLFRNFRYKAFALVMAVAIWVSLTQGSFQDVPIGPVRPEFTRPANFYVHMDALEPISLKLNCPKYIMRDHNLTPNQFSVEIVLGPQFMSEQDLIEAPDYTLTRAINLHGELVHKRLLPENTARKIMIDTITPNQLDVTVTLITKTIPLVPRHRGKPLEGYVARDPVIVSKPEIEITGSEEALAEIDQLELPAIDVAGMSSDATVHVEIELETLKPGSGIKLLRDSDRKVELLVPIELAVQVRPFSTIPVETRNIPPGVTVQISPDKVDIVVEGSPSLLDQVMKEELKADLDLTGYDVGIHEIPPVIRNLPDGVRIVERSTGLIRVEIEGRPLRNLIENQITK